MTRTRTSRCPPPRYTRTRDWDSLPATLNTAEVCGLLLCSDKTAVKLLNEGKIKGTRAGHAYVFDTASLREFICGR